MATELIFIEAPDGQIFSGEYGTIDAETEEGKPGLLIVSPSWARRDGSRIVVDPETGSVSGGVKISEDQAAEKLAAIAADFDKRAQDLNDQAMESLASNALVVYEEAISLGFSERVALIQARTVLPLFQAP